MELVFTEDVFIILSLEHLRDSRAGLPDEHAYLELGGSKTARDHIEGGRRNIVSGSELQRKAIYH